MSQPVSQSPTAEADDVAGIVGGAGRGGALRGWRLPLAAVLLAGLGLAGWLAWRSNEAAPTPQYRSTPASMGPLTVSVSATGNLEPVNQVDVGSEQSGTVTEVLVDDNDRVKKGQVLARLDTAKLADTVARSSAALAQAEAQLLQARTSTAEARVALDRLRHVARLSAGQLPAAAELSTAEATLARAEAAEVAAQAAVRQAQATLRSDRTNLDKAVIRSPIDGVVLARKVEPGQTVAASLQAPTLFTLAENLAQMRLVVNVDEADVGQVQAGQKATFSVDAHADRRYPATILRVGLGATTTNNVVSYATQLAVDNSDLSLRPGMTATAEIITLQRDQVLRVPNAALRWSPPAAAAASQPASGSRNSVIGSLMPRPPGGFGTPRNAAAAKPARGANQQVWVLDAQGRPQPVAVTVGASDGKLTQITGGALQAGQAVITEAIEAKR